MLADPIRFWPMNELVADTPLVADRPADPPTVAAEVFTLEEVSEASGVAMSRLREAVDSGELRAVTVAGVTYVPRRQVLAYFGEHGRRLDHAAAPSLAVDVAGHAAAGDRRTPFAASAAVHGLLLAVALIVTSRPALNHATVLPIEQQEVHLVYLAQPGPGGGGGGGGLRDAPRPTRAMREGHSRMNSPVPDPQPPAPVKPPPEPPKPQTLPSEPLPPVQAPIIAVPADAHTQIGVLDEPPSPAPPAHGPGTGGGAGTGAGSGVGPGTGSGIGPGSGSGTGGGPYRPGSGVTPPRILHEVKPDYTEEARQRNIEGEVSLQIIVRRDGTVGDVKVLRGLGYGLDARAIEAVRQFRFEPARRLGVPVDVVVTIDVAFELR